jgi:hypothetical protein
MSTTSREPSTRELSPEAQAATAWFRQLARALRAFQIYNTGNPAAINAREMASAGLADLLTKHGSWHLRFSATEIILGDEIVVRATGRVPGVEYVPQVTDRLPFLFYRDGIRRLSLLQGVERREVDILFDALRRAGAASDSQDDLVTLLWQANLDHVRLEVVPLEQTIYLSTQAGGGGGGAASQDGQVFVVAPDGTEIHSQLGQAAGAQGLHRDTFDDWALPLETVAVPEAFARLEPLAEASRCEFVAHWEDEDSAPWQSRAPDFLRGLLALDDSEDMRRTLARSVVTWLSGALRRVDWVEAQHALELLHELDPGCALCSEDLTGALAAVDAEAVADRLDESEAIEHSRFAAFTAALGTSAIGFCVDVMSRSGKARVRAAAVTALCYVCADDPALLAPWLADSRWHVVRNIVFVLGHIGGPEIVPLLRLVARHPEPRVRRQLVQALGQVPPAERSSLLLEQLDTRDGQLLSTALNMLSRQKDPEVARAILACIAAPDFDSRDESNQRALFGALAEVADDDIVPALQSLLLKGGWFARRTIQRAAAARTLLRLGTPRAMAVLEAGVLARQEAVRLACLEALGTRSRP